MTRHTSLSALRRCHPTLTTSLNNGCCAPLSLTPYASVGIASSQLLSPSLPRPFSRHLHLSSPRLTPSSAPQPKPEPTEPEPSSSDSESNKPSSSSSSEHQQPSPVTQLQAHISSNDLNPPSTTRPPPLNLPTQTRTTSTFSHLFATGKAFLTFYKTGLRQIWTNTKLIRSLPPPSSSSPSEEEPRSLLLLRKRNAHDLRRLPLFAVLLLICGEFTPFVVLLLPQIVPFTCRIPAQVRKLRSQAEERRAAARQEGRWRRESGMGAVDYTSRGEKTAQLVEEVETPIVARILGLVGQGWDRIGWVPSGLARRRVEGRWEFLLRDDEMIREDRDGVAGLVGEEVELACLDRGIDTVGHEVGELRRVLDRWLVLTGEVAGKEERRRRMEWLVTRGEEEW
ncbi:hypothetical protein GE09DRAFT_1191963 [Coniochaeta sp. 2T2.1]|nr:hypothetical protein GE09DRAFT_1191963 [Coniochaeta sp. 2T2.1]